VYFGNNGKDRVRKDERKKEEQLEGRREETKEE
jgi:hypothetical protein